MKYRAKIDRVVKFIMKRPDEELAGLSVAKLAAIFRIGRTTLAREFKFHREVTLVYYLCREKMIRAAFLLAKQVDISVHQVAQRMGFSCCRHFNGVFKKFFGTEPCKYREYQQIRSGVKDRRVGPVERREKALSPAEIGRPERRKNPGVRRKGIKDRRKNNREMKPFEPGVSAFSIQGLLKAMKYNAEVRSKGKSEIRNSKSETNPK